MWQISLHSDLVSYTVTQCVTERVNQHEIKDVNVKMMADYYYVGKLTLCDVNLQQMVSGCQHMACNWQWFGSDNKTWPKQWWRSGRLFEVMTSKCFRFEEAFIYVFICHLF